MRIPLFFFAMPGAVQALLPISPSNPVAHAPAQLDIARHLADHTAGAPTRNIGLAASARLARFRDTAFGLPTGMTNNPDYVGHTIANAFKAGIPVDCHLCCVSDNLEASMHAKANTKRLVVSFPYAPTLIYDEIAHTQLHRHSTRNHLAATRMHWSNALAQAPDNSIDTIYIFGPHEDIDNPCGTTHNTTFTNHTQIRLLFDKLKPGGKIILIPHFYTHFIDKIEALPWTRDNSNINQLFLAAGFKMSKTEIRGTNLSEGGAKYAISLHSVSQPNSRLVRIKFTKPK